MTEHPIIAEYNERIRGVLDRRLTLFADSVKVIGTVRGVRGEGLVPLAGLQKTPHKSWLRSKHYHWSLACLFILSPFVVLPFVVAPPNFVLLSIGVVLYLPALWYFRVARRHKEVAIFLNRSGVVGLDLWCSGPDAARFSDFVTAIQRQIGEHCVEQELPVHGEHTSS
jgi:hypothetical protein